VALENNTKLSIAQATLRQVWDLRLLGAASDTKEHRQLIWHLEIAPSAAASQFHSASTEDRHER
jgi:hypothetical protein